MCRGVSWVHGYHCVLSYTIVYYRIPSWSTGTQCNLVAACQRLRISQSVSEYHSTVSARSSGFQCVLGASCVCGRQSVSEWCWVLIEKPSGSLDVHPQSCCSNQWMYCNTKNSDWQPLSATYEWRKVLLILYFVAHSIQCD